MPADQRLIQFLKEGKDWERKATNIPGIFLLGLPGLKSAPPSFIQKLACFYVSDKLNQN